MTVTAPAGFEAAGIAAGIKRSGALDLAVIVNRGPSNASAAVFTSNRAKANPILWSEQVAADGRVAAIVLNSGGANCFTGPQGFQVTHRTAEAAAGALGPSSSSSMAGRARRSIQKPTVAKSCIRPSRARRRWPRISSSWTS